MDLEHGPHAASVSRAEADTINVLATTEDGTRAALGQAAQMAQFLKLPVVILVPHIIPHGVPLEGSGDDPTALGEAYRRLASQAGIEAKVRTCRCRDVRHIPGRLLLARARVVIGGHRRRWRSTEEEQVARALAGEGHRVTFVDVETGQSREEP